MAHHHHDEDTAGSVNGEEIAEEERWDLMFQKSQDMLSAMIDAALEQDRRGETRPLDDSLA